jgi:hypothetical protein
MAGLVRIGDPVHACSKPAILEPASPFRGRAKLYDMLSPFAMPTKKRDGMPQRRSVSITSAT